MGHTTSTDNDGCLHISLSKDQVSSLFSMMCKLKLSPVEVKSIATKLNVSNISEKNILSYSDLAYVLGLVQNKDDTTNGSKFSQVLRILYRSFKVIGSLPFLQDYWDCKQHSLTVNDVLITCLFASGKYKRAISPDYDFLKLVFVSLSMKQPEREDSKEKPSVKESISSLESYSVQAKKCPPELEQDEHILARRIKWANFSTLATFDDLNVDGLTVNANELHQILTFFLLLLTIPKMGHRDMQACLASRISKWDDYDTYALAILRYLDVNITLESEISYDTFKSIENIAPNLIPTSFEILFKNGLLSAAHLQLMAEDHDEPAETETFEESRVVNFPFLSLISTCLQNLDIQLSSQNLVKLYKGSEAGFSIRSLELRIFKWQAPTLVVVSGKRLKNKTILSNKRYQQFSSEYPRFFRSTEQSKQLWQADGDRITYAVLVNQPWRTSNKKNFGDERTIIISVSPRLDIYKSVHNQVLNGELIYFNTLGFGLGFGNDQPYLTHSEKRYIPGDVSLTIEPNLEFGVFRHVSSNTAPSYFTKSEQLQLHSQDFEDRFMITDMEVWGVGSTEELEVQRKQWEWEEKQAQARQSVNLKTIGEDRAFLEMVGLVGNHNAAGGSV